MQLGEGLNRGHFGLTACRPDQTLVFNLLSFGEHHSIGFNPRHICIQMEANVFPLQGSTGAFSIKSRAIRKDAVSLFNEMNSGVAVQEVCQLAGQLHSRGACPNNGEGCIGPSLVEQILDALTQLSNIAEVAESTAVFLHPGNAEIVGL
jgi:hypothetical protein